MSEPDLSISLGVEEEFFLVDPETRDLVSDPDPDIFEACERQRGPHRVVHEVLRSQIETSTKVCGSVAAAREALRETRRLVVESAEQHGVAVIAASSHPFAEWRSQLITPRERYERFAVTFQETMRRMLVAGMHVHAGFGDSDSRIRVMTALRRYLPLLHALSTSSPFHAGRETGFKSYRLSIMGAMPRTSMPGPLLSRADYDRIVVAYQRMQFIESGSELWWDVRPSHHYPTMEMRICDACPRLDDAVSIIALYASLVRRLLQLDSRGLLPPDPPTEIIAENRWLAQRYGVLAFFGDEWSDGRVDIEDYAAALVEQLTDDARALGCEPELRGVLGIIRDGTGADRQIDHFRLRRLEGDTDEEALRSVVDLVVAETREGIAAAA
jgi:carboxylate-amine ligase